MDRPLERRAALRAGVVWDDVRGLPLPEHATVVDIGGGTGGFAVRLAALGHQVVVVDPSPDALAALGRRAREADLASLVTGVQGDLSDLPDLPGLPGPADLVLCHGVLGLVERPEPALAALRDLLRPGGTLSLVVAQRHAMVLARAMAGHFQQARLALEATAPDPAQEGRFTADEIIALLVEAGFGVAAVHGVRVFTDLVPAGLLDLEPGATEALLELERAVAVRSEYLALAAALHVLASG
ncbi:methyltransferase domain-containing protein [Nocardioides mangrovicus]|uniref:Methyltransferase domain-containing protein n=1 Tax=Nocardioides mangrovicus TaxID=2478913 RepID=A0A3L8P0I1_9ACTN|nr:methyltransferase [Nocardioides mangrovicus]RLV48950.1 methyltransferase domain-containing protein [Nocardioides mangrovicus]